jgi:predicted RNase H-like nuclease (RuvC/YqgF family)
LPRSSSGLAGKIPRKPAPKLEEDEPAASNPAQEDDMRMEIDLVRRQSKADRAKVGNMSQWACVQSDQTMTCQYEKEVAVLQAENAELQRALQSSQQEVNNLKLQLSQAEEAKEREFEEVVKVCVKLIAAFSDVT